MIRGLKYFIIVGPVWGAYEGINSNSVNQQLTEDFNERCLDNNKTVDIKPNGLLNTVVFVSKDQGNIQNFNIKISCLEDNKSILFNL